MFQKHISRHLAAYEDRQLSAPKARRADTHLAGCERCRSELDQFRFAAAMMEHLPVTEAPESIWISVEAAIDRQPERASRFQVRYWRFAAAMERQDERVARRVGHVQRKAGRLDPAWRGWPIPPAKARPRCPCARPSAVCRRTLRRPDPQPAGRGAAGPSETASAAVRQHQSE